MKNYTNILLLIGSLIAFSCEDDDGSADSYSVNADYVGDWMQTYFAQYDGEACSGIPDFVDTLSTTKYTLNSDGTVLISGTWFCNEDNNTTEEMCQDTWGAKGNNIKIGTGFFTSIYTVTESNGETSMTLEQQVEVGTSMDDMSPACQKSTYTKQ
tara:strand:+ start:260 stop:724 length:465 start_codon:yes stop_codon:yes gene_type:complete